MNSIKKWRITKTEKNLKKILSKIEIDDFLIIHRFGKLYPGENIILVLVASEHRKDGLTFTKKSVEWFKKEITFLEKRKPFSHIPLGYNQNTNSFSLKLFVKLVQSTFW